MANRAKKVIFGDKKCFSIAKMIDEEKLFFPIFSDFWVEKTVFLGLLWRGLAQITKNVLYWFTAHHIAPLWCSIDVIFKNTTLVKI